MELFRQGIREKQFFYMLHVYTSIIESFDRSSVSLSYNCSARINTSLKSYNKNMKPRVYT